MDKKYTDILSGNKTVMHMSDLTENHPCLVDSSLWELASQSSQYACAKIYSDQKYVCLHCQAASTFSATDQKYTYEVLKAPRDQGRILCSKCWKRSIEIKKAIELCELKWKDRKLALEKDKEFIQFWLQQLLELEKFKPYKPNTAIKNMLKKLLSKNA